MGYVIGRFKRLRDEHALRGSRRRTVSAVIGYYENNRQHMRYDEYLAAGYPIGSGVAEGACRHVVKDRLEQTGMRWTVARRPGHAPPAGHLPQRPLERLRELPH